VWWFSSMLGRRREVELQVLLSSYCRRFGIDRNHGSRWTNDGPCTTNSKKCRVECAHLPAGSTRYVLGLWPQMNKCGARERQDRWAGSLGLNIAFFKVVVIGHPNSTERTNMSFQVIMESIICLFFL
jgi:hypothetical protein